MNANSRVFLGAGAALFVALILFLSTRLGSGNLGQMLSDGRVALTLTVTDGDRIEHMAQMILFSKHKRVLFYFLNTEAYYADEKKPIKNSSPATADRFKDITEIESSQRITLDRQTLTRILNLARPQPFFLEGNEYLKNASFQYPSGIQHFSGDQIMEFALHPPLKEGEYAGLDRLYRAESLLLSLFWRRKEIMEDLKKSQLLPLVHEWLKSGLSQADFLALSDELAEDYHASVLEVPLELVPGKNMMVVKEQRAHILYKTFTEDMRAGRLNEDSFPIAVLNGTEEAGLANRVKQAFSDRGIQVLTTDNLAYKPLATTVVIDRSGNTFQAAKLLQKIKLEENQVFFRRRVSDVDISFLLGIDFEIKKIFK